MHNQIIELQKKFEAIKNMNWVKSTRKGTDAVGRTFEHLLGQEENCLEIADFKGIEIKTKRDYAKSYIGLFNMTPIGKNYHEIKRLRDTYGYKCSQLSDYKVLNNSVYCNRRTFIGNKYQFMLKVNWDEQKIYLCIFDIDGVLLEKNVYWDFDTVKDKLYRKLKVVAFVKAHTKFINKLEYFKYYDMKFYVLKDFKTFVSLIERGIIRINFKISVFESGKRKGQIHDHGTSFDIKECDLLKLYYKYTKDSNITSSYDYFYIH